MFGANKSASFGGPTGNPGMNTGSSFSFGQTNNATQGSTNTNTGFGFNASNANTTSAIGGGLFGQGNATQGANPSGGLFGANAATSGATQIGSLFGQSSTAAQGGTPTGGLFGSNTANNVPATGGLFGGNTTAPAGGGLFGAAKPAGTTTGGLFGNTGTTQGTTTGGLFGNTGATTGGLFSAAKPPASGLGGGLFGNSNQKTTASTGGLFGAKPVTAGVTGSLFGASSTGGQGLFGTNAGTSNAGTSLFGNQPSTLGGGGGLFNAQQPQQPQSSLQSISQLPITPMTKIVDLPAQLHQEIEQLDQYIQRQVQISQHLKADAEEHMGLIFSIPRDLAYLTKNQSITKQSLSQDLRKIATAKETTEHNLNHTQQFAILFQQMLTPDSKVSSLELDKFFQQKIHMYQVKLDDYFNVLSDIESTVNGINGDLFGGDSNTYSHFPQADASNIYSLKSGLNALVSTVIEEFKLFMDTAERVAELHQKVKEYTVNNSSSK